MGDWQLLWEVDSTETSRVTDSSTTTNYDLISGEAFSNHEILVAWIDNNVNREGKFMYVDRDRFATVFTTTDSGGGWVDWSDSGWIGLKYLDDDTFRKTGGGMGIRKLYGINNASVSAVQGEIGPAGGVGPAGADGTVVAANPSLTVTEQRALDHLQVITIGDTNYHVKDRDVWAGSSTYNSGKQRVYRRHAWHAD